MAAQYRPALVAAEADLQAARASVAEWLISQQAAINDVALYARNVTPALAKCHSLAEQLQTLLSDPRVGLVARSHAKEESERLLAEAAQLEQLAAAAEKALEARALLARAEEKKFIDPVEAVRLLHQAEDVTRGLPASVQCVADATDAVRVATKAVQNALKATLADHFQSASALRLAFQRSTSAPAKLADILEALRSIAEPLWSGSLNEIAARIRSTVLSPLLQATNVKLVCSDDDTCTLLAGNSLAMSSLTPSIPLDNSIAVLQFVHKVFPGAPEAAKRVANALWPEVQAYVQDKYILDTLPSVYADLKTYDAPSRILELEQLAASLGIEAAKTGTLSELAKDVDGNFVKAIAQRTLGSLRATLLDERWDSVSVGEYDPLTQSSGNDLFEVSPVQFPRCTVSSKSQACINAARVLLDVTAGASANATAALWRSARDAAALYVTVVKYAHKPKLAQVPRLGLLYYTDCMYIAHEILFIGYAYKSQDSVPLSFVDVAETTREVAEEHFAELLRQHEAEALELLAEAEGFAYTHLPGPRSRAVNAIKRVVHFCQQHTTLSAGVLPSHLHRSIAEAITDRVFAETAKAVLRLTDIDQNARLSELLLQLVPLAADSEKNIANLDRLQKLITLLDARLVDIPVMYESGALQSFTVPELLSLVRALFSDSPLRQNSLLRINSAKPAVPARV